MSFFSDGAALSMTRLAMFMLTAYAVGQMAATTTIWGIVSCQNHMLQPLPDLPVTLAGLIMAVYGLKGWQNSQEAKTP